MLVSSPDVQSMLEPAGTQAERIHDLTTLLLIVVTIVWLLVASAFFVAIRRKREGDDRDIPVQRHRRAFRVVATATGLTIVALFVVTTASVLTSRDIERLGEESSLVVEVIGQRWWWEVRYPLGEEVHAVVPTANEIHIPTGVPVRFKLTSPDVIHSFWLPKLHGKMDMIPSQYDSQGHLTHLDLRADRPGVFRGQCAEFCGKQHANMGFIVVAEDRRRFEAWLRNEAAPARAAEGARIERGQEVFLSSGCPSCHRVRGLERASLGRLGPDLTHLGSRLTLAATTLPNRRGHLAGWVSDPQSTKPGNLMPRSHISPGDFQALIDYLRFLE